MDLNQKYFELLFNKKDSKKDILVLKDERNDSKVVPFSISSFEDEAEFNLFEYKNLKENLLVLKNTDLKILKMQAGLGSSVKRNDLVKGKLSAKGVDLKLIYKDVLTPIAKIQLYIKNELSKKEIYKSVKFQNLVNDETKEDIEKLSESFNVLESIEQLKMPTINQEGNLSTKRQAPCGHGFVGIYEIVDAIVGSSDEIVCIGNGEDLNSTIDTKIASLVVEKDIPILMVSTDKTESDMKGGQLAIVKEDRPYLTIVEKAQAESSNQLDYFEELGLREGDKKALFNTNIAVINKKALKEIVRDKIKDFDLEKFLFNIAPDVILNRKEQNSETFTQLESALGSVLLNTDKYFRENFDTKILSILNLSNEYRDQFFLPIKKREDYDFIKNNYIFDEATLKLKKITNP